MTDMDWKRLVGSLEELKACDEALDWITEERRTFSEGWQACSKPDWMLWVMNAAGVDQTVLRRIIVGLVKSVYRRDPLLEMSEDVLAAVSLCKVASNAELLAHAKNYRVRVYATGHCPPDWRVVSNICDAVGSISVGSADQRFGGYPGNTEDLVCALVALVGDHADLHGVLVHMCNYIREQISDQQLKEIEEAILSA